MTTYVGQTPSEKLAADNEVCRQIVKEISNFGVSQRQLKLLIYTLALELENVEQMRVIAGVVKDTCGNEIFITNLDDVL
jgi:hypothetical protein